jgi:hypothetical protein
MFTGKVRRAGESVRMLLRIAVRRTKSIYSSLDCYTSESKESRSVKRKTKKLQHLEGKKKNY